MVQLLKVLNAQFVLGFIVDEQTGLGIQNASISIGTKEKVVYSYRYGDYYRLVLPGTYEVVIITRIVLKFHRLGHFPTSQLLSQILHPKSVGIQALTQLQCNSTSTFIPDGQ
jgi:hypothetical protein